MVLVAIFVVAVPTAVAQTPVADQYDVVAPGGGNEPTGCSTATARSLSRSPSASQTLLPKCDAPDDIAGDAPGDGSGSDPDDIAGVSPGDDSGSAPADGGATAPVSVDRSSSAAPGSLPFTGTQVSPVALIGLGLLALGVVGAAVARRRGVSVASQHA
jgi:hypothetical protein